MAEKLNLYESVISRPSNKKEIWMEFFVQAMRAGWQDFHSIYEMARRQGVDISEPWAHEVSESHMSCVTFSNRHVVMHQPDGLAISAWRDGLGSRLPNLCGGDRRQSQCLSSPENGNTRCPVLFGRSVVLEREGVHRYCNGREFNEISLVIGDGPLIESIQIADNPEEAVVSIDPKIRWGVRMVNDPIESHIQSVMGDQFISLAELDKAFRSEVYSYYMRYRSNRNIFPVNSGFQVLKHDIQDGFFDHVYCSFPYPSSPDSFWRELITISINSLRRGGDIVFRTENRRVQTRLIEELAKIGYEGNLVQNKRQYPRTLYSLFFTDSLDLAERIIRVIKK